MKRSTSERLPSEQTINSMGPLVTSERMVFDNQIPLMNVTEFCSRFGYSKKTIYDWKYRPKKNRIPEQMVVKIRGKLFVRTDLFKNLIPF